jgi:hypothetical protein
MKHINGWGHTFEPPEPRARSSSCLDGFLAQGLLVEGVTWNPTRPSVQFEEAEPRENLRMTEAVPARCVNLERKYARAAGNGTGGCGGWAAGSVWLFLLTHARARSILRNFRHDANCKSPAESFALLIGTFDGEEHCT